tara:strand:- start:341 stop:541 length:201 start_codon:yes stop_codon:yes gene_type:complete
MAHIHMIEDEKGDMIDRKVYCSDSCNTYDNQDNYQGWNGCYEISFSQPCDRKGCCNTIKGIEDFED